jgi:ATPase family associated with various cellular activities (AAA)
MTQPSSEYPTELEVKTKFYLQLIRRIDEILADPVKTLIRITDEYILKTELPRSKPIGFPVWMSDHLQPEPGDDLFSKAICFATLQEIGKLRRRFTWLSDSDSKRLRRLLNPEQELAHNRLINNLLPPDDDFLKCVKSLSSTTFGALNPFTASEVFQVLLRDSERYAHGALGFLAFFAMIWPLHRRFPDPQRFGAAIEPWEPKAYVTAKCILPIKTLQDICSERAALMSEIVGILSRLKQSAKKEKGDPYQRWLFNAELDDLRTRLLRLSSIVVAKEKLRRRSEQVRDFADGLSQNLGYTLMTPEDLTDPTALAFKLRHSRDPLSTYIRRHCGKTLAKYKRSGAPPQSLPEALVDDLNRLLRGPCIFNKKRFARVLLSKEIQAFVDEEPRGGARIYLNWRLLLEAYPDEIRMNRHVGASFKNILKGAAKAIEEIGKGGVEVFKDADDLLKAIDIKVVKRLKNPSRSNLAYLAGKGFKFAREYVEHPDKQIRTAYFKDLHAAARDSLRFCRRALKTLNSEYGRCSRVTSNFKSINSVASRLATANDRVAAMMENLVKDATAWCGRVADREIAHASAQNLTDFDPSELVSAIAVAVRWNQMTTTLQVSDAVDKALAGMRTDGSWSSGQPFYSPNNAVGIWPITSDVVLTLTEALDEHPEVEVADAALFRYVDWLERTHTELLFPRNNQSDQKTEALAVGWSSDRFRNRRKIHFPTTAFSVSALLKVRDLVEHRLWQLCEKRFTVIKSRERSLLKKAAPVDLGAQHLYRLHRHLAWIAERQKRDYEYAEYSLVLHGPPGSSKTFIAKALSVEQWKAIRPWGSKEEPRLVRITPADFTRMGEDRLDSEARLIFDLISGVRGVTIFFDEIDDLLRQRNVEAGPMVKPTFMELVVPAMLNRLADLRDACPRQEICVLLATNFIESIEPALLRRGRIDRLVPVVYPDQESRLALIIKFTSKPELITVIERELRINKNQVSKRINDYATVFAEKLSGWPYLTIESACRKVVYDLDQLLRQMSGEAGSLLSLEQKRERFVLQVDDSIRQVVKESSSSLSTPRYEERLVPPFRPELLDEYAHFIIASRASGKDLENWVETNYPSHEFNTRLSDAEHNQAISKLSRSKALYGKIRTVLDNENRWTENRKVREMLGTLASLDLS